MTERNAERRNELARSDRNPWPRFLFLVSVVAAAALIRVIPPPVNFGPVGAIALFSGAMFTRTRNAFLMPLLALFASDLVLGFYATMPVVYGSFAVYVLLGRWLRSRRRVGPIALGTLLGSVQFFIVTNFACWAMSCPPYPHTLAGLGTCYVAALPFFPNTLFGDALFTAAFFGAVAVVERLVPALRESYGLTHA